jgi:membrane protein
MEEKSPGLWSRLYGGFKRAEAFIRRDLWLKLPEAAGPRLFYRALRVGVLIVEGFIRTDVFMLSAALTYQVLFALVPLLVVMLAVIKGVGGFSAVGGKVQQFILESILPRMGTAPLKDGESGTDIKTIIDSFIQNVNATAVGVIGGIALLYTSISLLMSIENVLNRIWGIKNPRTILRRLTVYWTFLTLSPILLAASLSMTGVVQSNFLYRWLNTNVPYFGTVTLVLTPYVVAWILFTLFYIFMPNTRVHPGAALIGALISGSAWEGMKTVYFWYNTHVVTNYKFYGSLGTIPVFLLWIYLSWIIVLFGAEVAFAAQHVNTYRREVGQVRLSAADRDRMALVIALEVVKPFVAGAKPPTGEDVALRLNSPVRIVNEILFELAAQGILRAVTLPDQKDAGYLPAKDPAVTTARDVVTAIRTFGDHGALPDGQKSEVVYHLIDRAEAEAMGPLSSVTIRQLAERQAAPPPSTPSSSPNPAPAPPVTGNA